MTGLDLYLCPWLRQSLHLLMGTALLWISPAYGITFNFTYNAAQSTPPATISDSFGPITDPNGTVLLNMTQTVSDMWSDIILDDWMINVELRWQAPANAGNSAQMFQFQGHPGNTDGDPAEQNNRVVWAQIIFNPNRNWWVDSTPLGHSEFDMAQTLYRDLPMAQQTGWFNGSPPNLLEAGFSGAVNGSAPAGMQTPGSASATLRSRDLFSYILHELGHTVGVGGTTAAANEYGTDGDYDINSALAGGAVFSIDSTSTNDGHITSSPTSPTAPVLMHTNNLCCARRLPSALDVMAAEATANWTDIRLLRTDFLTGANWNTAANWEGNRTPSTAVDTFVRHGGTVTLSGFGAAGNLLVDEGSIVSTQTSTLFVQNSTTVGGTSGDTSQVTINTNGELDSDILNINFDGRVRLVGDSSVLQSERINIASGGTLEGRGTIDLNDPLFGQLTSAGRIRVTGGELVITSQNNLGLDLVSGVIEAIDGNLRFDTGMLSGMGADLTVGAGRQVDFDSSGSIGAGGLLNLVGQPGNPATSTGSTLFVGFNGVVNANGLGVVENPLVLLPSSFVTTQFGDPNSEIRFNGSTFFQGGSLLGSGTARQNGDAFIDADTDIIIATYDMDGQFGNTTITIGSGHTLQINSPNIDTSGANDFDGTIEVNGGTLHMVPDWTLDGTLNLTQDGASGELDGPGRMTVSTSGRINVSGAGRLVSDVTLAGKLFVASEADFNGNTIVTATAELETNDPDDAIDFNGATILGGGSYVGGGVIRFDGDVQVIGNTSIGMAQTDLDGDNALGSISVAPGVTFSVASITLDPNDDAYDAVMNVRGAFSSIVTFQLDGTLNLIQEQRQAIPQLNGLTGFTVRSSGEVNTVGDAQINRSTLVQGDLNVGAGVTQINGSTIVFENTAHVGVADDGLLELNGTTTYEGGAHTGAGIIQFNGETNINSNTTINTARVDLDGALESTTINLNDAQLMLNVNTIDMTSNIFSGSIHVVGQQAQLEVNLSNPFNGWRQSSTSLITFINPNLAGGAVNMLTGSDLSAEGIINGTGRVALAVNMAVQNRLNTVTANSDIHFAGSDRSTVHQNPTATIAGLGSITIDDGTTVNFEHETLVAVNTENSGRLEIGFQASEVAIDYTAPGKATIRGTYSQATSGEFAVDLGGLEQSTKYDLLEIIGTARLNGTIEVQLINNFLPSLGDTFQVLTATSILNEFDTIVTIDETNMFDFEVTAIYSATDVVLQIDDVYLSADFDHDEDVDGADFLIMQAGLGLMMEVDNTNGDANGDGVVGAEDMSIWQSQYGSTFAAIAAAVAVPEPATGIMLLLGIATMLTGRRTLVPKLFPA